MHELRSPVTLHIRASSAEECDAIHDALEKALQRVLDEGGTLSDWPEAHVEILHDSKTAPAKRVWLVASMVEGQFGASLHATESIADDELRTFEDKYELDDNTWILGQEVFLPDSAPIRPKLRARTARTARGRRRA